MINWFRERRATIATISALVLALLGAPSLSPSADIQPLSWIAGAFVELFGWVEQHDGAIVALSSVVIMFFTATLYYTTRDMTKSAELQSRAYVLVESVAWQAGLARVSLRNYGLTPAVGVQAAIGVIAAPLPLGNQVITLPERGPDWSSAVMPPSGSMNIEITAPVSQTDAVEIGAGRRGLYICGSVEYRDTFHEHRLTKFRFVASRGDFINGLVFGPTADGNEIDGKQ